MFLGLDTSNYTTSAALYSEGGLAKNVSRLLPVRAGELGLRQSDALFHHVCRLPEIMEELFASGIHREELRAVAASTRPRAVEGSYMPCFHAGESFAKSLAHVLGVPFYGFSHQQGHIAAALFSADRMDLLQKPHLAWHLSGGTTELLLVHGEENLPVAEKIGGTTDLSAGQIIDRTGKLLHLDFPSGKALEKLAGKSAKAAPFRVKREGLFFSLSGLENKIQEYDLKNSDPAGTAAYALASVIDAVVRTTEAAAELYPGLEIVFSGGVSSNGFLRERCAAFSPIFAAPELSTDNAMGIAVLCGLREV